MVVAEIVYGITVVLLLIVCVLVIFLVRSSDHVMEELSDVKRILNEGKDRIKLEENWNDIQLKVYDEGEGKYKKR